MDLVHTEVLSRCGDASLAELLKAKMQGMCACQQLWHSRAAGKRAPHLSR